MSNTTQRLIAVVAEHDREIMRLRLENEKLRAENGRLRADKDRLDWIERNALSVDLVADPDGLVQVWYNTDPPKVSAAKWVRAAIDAAMKEKSNES